jgi:hypothetical protein
MNFDNFEVNLIPAIVKGYEEKFAQGKNVIGASEIPFGLRSTIIKKREDLKLKWKNDLLAGKILHRGFQKKEVIYYTTQDINTALGYEEKEVNGERFIKLDNGNYMKFEALSEYDFVKKYPEMEYIKVGPNQFVRQHPDTWTTLYCIEDKTTTLPKGMWKELAPYFIMQLNTCLGLNKHLFGFLRRCDVGFTGLDSSRSGFFKSKSTKFGYIWNKYFIFYPHNFNVKLWKYTLVKIEDYFDYMENEEDLSKIDCPDFIFECDGKCKEYCPNPIEKVKVDVNEVCVSCKQEIRVGTSALIRNDKMYHHTDEHGERYESCIWDCKKAWKVVKNGNEQSIADMMIDNYMSGGLE